MPYIKINTAEDDKYYRPKIEEFHVGFKYDQRHPTTGNWMINNSVYDYMTFHEIKDELKNDNIRVKYLDLSDIKDCGWVDTPIKDLYYHPMIKASLAIMKDRIIKILPQSGSDGFMGTIKNVSELKFIMRKI